MKIEITERGWKEIEATNIIIGEEFDAFKDMTVENWVKANKRLRLNRGMRNHCSCCHTAWNKLSGDTHLFSSNKGNKLICDLCYEKLGKKCH